MKNLFVPIAQFDFWKEDAMINALIVNVLGSLIAAIIVSVVRALVRKLR